jgi:hypothetical protein
MNNRYVLPVSFALAVHGALLFGFSKQARPLKIEEITILTPFHHSPQEEEPVVTVMERTEAAAKSAPAAPQPDRSQELPSIELDVTQIAVPRPSLPEISGTDLRTIPDFAPGIAGENGPGTWRTSFASKPLPLIRSRLNGRGCTAKSTSSLWSMSGAA